MATFKIVFPVSVTDAAQEQTINIEAVGTFEASDIFAAAEVAKPLVDAWITAAVNPPSSPQE